MKIRHEINCDSKELAPLRKKVKEFLSDSGWSDEVSGSMLLCIDEALTNVMRHAYDGGDGQLSLEINDDSEKVVFAIEDFGKKFDPTTLPEPKLPKESPGGLGVFFIKSIMDDFVYDSEFKEGNRIYLTKYKNTHRDKS